MFAAASAKKDAHSEFCHDLSVWLSACFCQFQRWFKDLTAENTEEHRGLSEARSVDFPVFLVFPTLSLCFPRSALGYRRLRSASDVSTGSRGGSVSSCSMCFWISSHCERNVISLMVNFDSLRASSTRIANLVLETEVDHFNKRHQLAGRLTHDDKHDLFGRKGVSGQLSSTPVCAGGPNWSMKPR